MASPWSAGNRVHSAMRASMADTTGVWPRLHARVRVRVCVWVVWGEGRTWCVRRADERGSHRRSTCACCQRAGVWCAPVCVARARLRHPHERRAIAGADGVQLGHASLGVHHVRARDLPARSAWHTRVRVCARACACVRACVVAAHRGRVHVAAQRPLVAACCVLRVRVRVRVRAAHSSRARTCASTSPMMCCTSASLRKLW
jgi:hypothetical protein